jgi:4-oxalomesaconate hydratase
MAQTAPALLVVSAHAGDFVWRAGGAIAAATMRGERATVVCLSYGERGESASQWLQGKDLDEIKAIRRGEAEAAASALGADIVFLDLGDYPLRESPEAVAALVDVYRRVQPTVVLTHPLADPYNGDHPAAARMALEARVLAQAIGVANSDGTFPSKDDIIGAPPVFFFEPHQPEQSDFKPNVLLDITEAFPRKRAAMECLPAQKHMWSYYTDLAIRRGVQVKRNAGPNLGLAHDTMGEAYMRYFPQVTGLLE